jgi:hypothetical protein
MQFQFSNYDSSIISTKIYLSTDEEFLQFLNNSAIVGSIGGEELEFRPRQDTYGVMFDFAENGEFWCHVPTFIFEKYLEQQNN